jgi:Tol biopolymer transport system component
MRLAPDGRRIVVNPDRQIWLIDGARQVPLTSGPAQNFGAIWSPDGSEIAFERDLGAIVRKGVQQDAAEAVIANVAGTLTDWSRGGLLAITATVRDDQGADIILYDLKARASRPWLSTTFDEGFARFSPNGEWVAYVSNATGRDEVFIRAAGGTSAPLVISSGGGLHPAWRGDGRELFYLGPQDEIFAVDIETSGNVIQAGEPRLLFRIPLNDITRNAYPPYAVSPDGQRFLLNVPEAPSALLYIRGIRQLIEHR